MFGMKFFSRTSNRRTFNLASFHSPHSLTWSWILSLTMGAPMVAPYAYVRREYGTGRIYCAGAGLGGLIGFSATRNNNGWQWSASLLFAHLSWSRQRPMFFRDMYWQTSDAQEAIERENRHLRRELDLLRHNAARSEPQTVPSHLH